MTDLQRLVLKVVAHYGGQGWGRLTWREVRRRGKECSIGSIYGALFSLERRGHVTRAVGWPRDGGRRRTFWTATFLGLEYLREYARVHEGNGHG